MNEESSRHFPLNLNVIIAVLFISIYIDFHNQSVFIFRGKGAKDRYTLLPQSTQGKLQTQIEGEEGVKPISYNSNETL